MAQVDTEVTPFHAGQVAVRRWAESEDDFQPARRRVGKGQGHFVSAAANSRTARLIASLDQTGLRATFGLPDHLEILMVVALGKPAETVVVLEDGSPDSRPYWRDADSVHHVPKRPLAELRVEIQFASCRGRQWLLLAVALLVPASGLATHSPAAESSQERRSLYVAAPGIRDYLEYGGHGLLVFDIDHGHRFVRRIPTKGLSQDGKPLNVKGVCASATTARIYISTTESLTCLDLTTDNVLWERRYEGGCDRMAISPDGTTIYLPSFEKDHWHVVNALSGDVIAKIVTKSGAHNTIYGPDGRFAYMAGLRSPLLSVAETTKHTVARTVGPFSASIRPYTINGSQTLCFVNVNELLGFEIGDIITGKVLHRVEVRGFKPGPVKRHGCPSHGIGLTPDEKEIWLTDGANCRLHLFDVTAIPPKQLQSIELRDQPGWITFSVDGRFAYPSTGDVIETATRKIIAGLKDESGTEVQSEKLLEIDFLGDRPCHVGNQFGIGQVGTTAARK